MPAPDAYRPDEIETLLEGSASPAAAGEPLRRELLARTTGVIRRRRHMRRFGIFGAVACAYLAGVMTVSLRTSRTETVIADLSVHQSSTARRDAGEDANPAGSEVAASTLEVPLGALSESGRYELFCRAADRHLTETGDFTAALNLYRQALNTANEDELAIAAGRDTWLLMALKNARQQERTDEKPEI